jgi:serine/threonine protein kinase
MAEDFGGYRLVRSIAVGGVAEVFEAKRIADGAPRAIKRLHRALAHHPDQVELFRQEARLARDLVHPGLVRALDAGQIGDDHYIALELVAGPTLADLERPTVPRAVAIVTEVAAALDHLHRHGWVHADVNPSNILVGAEGTKLIDLGVATPLGQAQPAVRGTFGYMSPEQVRGEPLDARSDVFALAVVLWELVAGRPLFQRRERHLTLAATVEDPAPLLGYPTLDPFLQSALAKSPTERGTGSWGLTTDS